ncbi:hypothetical protein MBLNU230_g1056t1 [Neophaeotheca triangularis]
MNSRTLRRLAADHGALHNQPLPPNYLFPPTGATADSLTEVDILLAGPTHTPFEAGVFKLHLNIPPEYPQAPPTANFRTPIFHPNVEQETGGVCVETLKRDWDAKLTLRDVLVTICCLLIQPNPDSALNAEAGALIRDDYEAFSRRAKLMTSIHAVIPRTLKEAVQEAQERGQEVSEEPGGKKMQGDTLEGPAGQPAGGEPVRRRRTVARVRGTAAARRADASPSGAAVRRRAQPGPSRPFAVPAAGDDIFGLSRRDREQMHTPSDTEEDSIFGPSQENDATRSPVKAKTPTKLATPKRPQGAPVPLGELTMEDAPPTAEDHSWDTSEDMEPEYPPSPRKSASKSPRKRIEQAERSTNTTTTTTTPDALHRAPNMTPPNNHATPLATSSPFAPTAAATDLANPTPSPRKTRNPFFAPAKTTPLAPPKLAFPLKQQQAANTTRADTSTTNHKTKGKGKAKAISKPPPSSPSSAEKRARAASEARVRKMWELCGGDVGEWNRGSFGSELGWEVKASRW